MKITEFKSIGEEAEVKVKKKFAPHIPKALAQRFDLGEGGKMRLCVEGNKLILDPIRVRDAVELANKEKKFASLSFEEVETRKEEELKEFLRALEKASRNIEEYYFKVAMANLEGHRFRERVYCYELYHQLRLALPANFPYTLQGEMDKMKHPIITGGVKPDFILHKPGTMNDNLLVIEVKPLNNTRSRQIKKDLDTLTEFLDLEKGYYCAIYLIYGTLKRKDEGISKIIKAYQDYNQDFNRPNRLNKYKNKLLLLWHKTVGQPAERYNWEYDVFNKKIEGRVNVSDRY